MVNNLTTAMLKAQDMSVPRVSPSPYSVCLTPEIKAMIQLRNSTRRFAQRNPHMRSVIHTSIYAQSRRIKNEINKMVNMNFSHKISTLNDDTSRKSLWKMTKYLKKRRNVIPPLQVDGTTLLTPDEKCNALADTFSQNHENPYEQEDVTHTNHVNSTVRRYINNCSCNT